VNNPSPPAAVAEADDLSSSASESRTRATVWAILLMIFYQQFAVSITGIAAPWIGKSFRLDDAGMARLFAWISVSALGAFVLSRMIDQFGRRRMVLWCLGAIPVCSLGAACATNLAVFAIFEIALNAVVVAAGSGCIVMLAEELPIERRAGGQGLAGFAGAAGGGISVMLVPVLVGYGLSWRWLLALAAAGVLLLPSMARLLPESERWEHSELEGITRGTRFYDVFHPIYRRRAITMIVCTLLAAFSQAAAQGFSYYHAVNDVRLTAGGASLMTILGGGVGMIGFPIGAWICERWGRVPTVVGFGVLFIVSQLWFYWIPAPLFIMPMLWLAVSFSLVTVADSGGTVGANAAMTELFPTALRGTITGWFAVMIAIGSIASNAVAGAIAPMTGGLPNAIGFTVLAGVPAAILFAFLIDETRGLPLEVAAREEEFRVSRA
jgi:MFS family permease